MSVEGTVREWDAPEGWGVIDTPQTPGGCWTHFSAVAVDGYKALVAGQKVLVEWEAVGDQDGYQFRAVRVTPS